MFRIVKFFTLLFFFAYCNSAYSVSVIRDSEVEVVVKELAQPLFSAAGIDGNRIKVFIINDSSINAFVIDNNSIFIHLGLLQYSAEPYVLLGILAHEIAHISAGHILQMSGAVSYFQSIAMISYMVGLVSTIIINPQVASAILLSGVALSSRLFFNYSQEQESAADSYALRYLDESGYDNSGMKEVFGYFKSIEHENTEGYFRTHPLSDKRIFAVQNYKVKNDVKPILADKLIKFKRMVTKLDSFFSPIHVLSNKYEGNSEYVNAIVHYRQGKIEEAIAIVDSLVQKSRDDPYLYELKAEMLYKAGNLSETIKMYEESLKYLSEKNSYLVKLALSHALLLYGDTKKAIFYLEQIAGIEPNNAFVWKYLSIAHRRNADTAMHYFALTKKACIEGNLKQFMKYAELAVKTLPKDSPYLLQIEDMKQFNG
ncbi:M48 family metalloprotease [Wolbachia endosymbiont of Atemnus politus]|uniref:M48 family metalloprotease n=1 Tax=Wolbachia endosymbiont of Atemnus politus TaxID=2682840 RepID=UPI001571C0A4|nr:M48 family metalloprotease [Wolbachia endosymbiont of Atemnus politus]NSM56505.1 M48 family metalloprotease [Wolbachia endosymbiont of Atemnus politus]NSX83309.1 M48 family metalloprotease [Wolbachia endosymbiont of Atemnus politus]